jgi:hypothetical protein
MRLLISALLMVFVVVVLLVAFGFVLMEAHEKIGYLREKAPWFVKIIEKRESFNILFLFCVFLLIGNGIELINKEVPEVPLPPIVPITSPPPPLMINPAYHHASNSPDLKPKILVAMVAPAGDGNKDSLVSIVGTITNFGKPSAVADFTMSLQLPHEKSIEGQFPIAPNKGAVIGIGKSAGGNDLSLHGDDYLTYAAEKQAIPANVPIQGWLMAVFSDVTKEQIFEKKAKLILTCIDPMGKKTSAEWVFSAKPSRKIFGMNEIQKQPLNH